MQWVPSLVEHLEKMLVMQKLHTSHLKNLRDICTDGLKCPDLIQLSGSLRHLNRSLYTGRMFRTWWDKGLEQWYMQLYSRFQSGVLQVSHKHFLDQMHLQPNLRN